MEDEERYVVASASSGSGVLNVWQRRDGSTTRTQTNCRPRGPACISSVVHRGHLFCASANPSSSATLMCAHGLRRAVGGPVARCSAPEPDIVCVALSLDAQILAAGGQSGRCYLWSLASGDLVGEWDPHFRAVTRIVFTDDGETVLTGGADAAVYAFDVGMLVNVDRVKGDTPRPVAELQGHSLGIAALCVGFGGASARVASASADRTVKVWHLSSGECIGSVMVRSPVVEAVFACDESVLLVGQTSGEVVVLDMARMTGTGAVSDRDFPRLIPPSPSSVAPRAGDGGNGMRLPGVTALATSPHGSEAVVGYDDGHVRVYDIASEMLLLTYSKHGGVPVSWVGVLSLVSEEGMRDAGGAGGGAEGALNEGLLYDGPLRKVVDLEALRTAFAPRVCLSGSGDADATWAIVDRVLDTSLRKA